MNNKIHSITVAILSLLVACAASGVVAGQGIDCEELLAFESIEPSPEKNLGWNYFSLGCTDEEWNGYFAPENWRVYDHESRVIPTEGQFFYAAAGKSGRGADGILLKGARTRVRRWSIEVPATGFLSFRLEAGPEQELSRITFGINDRVEKLGQGGDGVYYSPFLRPGDRFTLFIPPGESPLRWSDLYFHTNANGVMVYPGEARVRDRFRPVNAPPIERVSFPTTHYGHWPVFDYDGDETTLDDRCELRQSNAFFKLDYQDSTVLHEGRYELRRTFTVSENCERGNRIESVVSWMPLPLIPTETR